MMKKFYIFSLATASNCDSFSKNLILPALPMIALSLHSSPTAVKHLVVFYYLGLLLSRLFVTNIFEARGFGLLLLISAFYIIISLVSGAIDNLYILYAIRLLQAFCIGFLPIFVQAIVFKRVNSQSEYLKLAAIAIFFSFPAIFFATLTGAYLVYYLSWHANFYALTIVGVMSGIIIAGFALSHSGTEQEKQSQNPANIFKNFMLMYASIKNRQFLKIVLISSLLSAGRSAYYTYMAFIFVAQLHVSVIAFGYFGLILSAATLTSKQLNYRIIKRINMNGIFLLGILITLASGVSLFGLSLLIKHHTWIIITIALTCVFFYFVGNIAVDQISRVYAMQTFPKHAASVSGFQTSVNALFSVIGSLIAAWVSTGYDLPWLGLMFSSYSLLSLLLFLQAFISKKAT